ncbi:hypothetical protein PR048_000557 [Dryococelus australis]|uniref:Uncharacterized protein n=1 Tax=Dryococelus australis TaxID=614101 RepID=A0ABQ9IF02_9NEOP|nr:hypothetical protein PR048_000557 [Dryococelus australis]
MFQPREHLRLSPQQAKFRHNPRTIFPSKRWGPRWISGQSTQLPPRRTGLNSGGVAPRIFTCGTMSLVSGFSGGSPVSPPLHSGAAPYSTRATLIGSQDLDVKSGPNLFTPLSPSDVAAFAFRSFRPRRSAGRGGEAASRGDRHTVPFDNVKAGWRQQLQLAPSGDSLVISAPAAMLPSRRRSLLASLVGEPRASLLLRIWSGAGIKGRGKREIPEKTRRPTASSGTIPTCENPVTRPRIEPGSPWWEASRLTAQPQWPQEGMSNWPKGRGEKEEEIARSLEIVLCELNYRFSPLSEQRTREDEPFILINYTMSSNTGFTMARHDSRDTKLFNNRHESVSPRQNRSPESTTQEDSLLLFVVSGRAVELSATMSNSRDEVPSTGLLLLALYSGRLQELMHRPSSFTRFAYTMTKITKSEQLDPGSTETTHAARLLHNTITTVSLGDIISIQPSVMSVVKSIYLLPFRHFSLFVLL